MLLLENIPFISCLFQLCLLAFSQEDIKCLFGQFWELFLSCKNSFLHTLILFIVPLKSKSHKGEAEPTQMPSLSTLLLQQAQQSVLIRTINLPLKHHGRSEAHRERLSRKEILEAYGPATQLL